MSEFTILPTGTVVAKRYQILKVLGKGGMGAVYQAMDAQTSMVVALKTLRTDLYEREDLVKRFEREARAAARIGHPSIVGVHAVGHDDALRTRFIVQEQLRGNDVAGCLNELGSLSPLSAVAVAVPVMEALIAAHASGIVHRDIKPENVFLHEMDDGSVVPKVIDFGIAKVLDELDRIERTATGMVFGTPWYMSPEQALGDSSIDARTDVWSVGAMIYEMLCGTLPFSGTSPNAVMAQIIFGVPTPLEQHWPDAPADLQAVIHKALERDLDKRWATMADFRDALVGCALWRDVTPELARSFLPRPSSFEGIGDILPAEFMEGLTDLRRRRPSRLSSGAASGAAPELFDVQPVVISASPRPLPATLESAPEPALSRSNDLVDEERIPTQPVPQARPAPTGSLGSDVSAIELPLPLARAPLAAGRVPAIHKIRRRHRSEFDTPRPAAWSRGGPSRVVSGISIALAVFCGAVLVFGVAHWMRRPQAELVAASYVMPAALRSVQQSPPGAPELPQTLQEACVTERDRTSDEVRRQPQ